MYIGNTVQNQGFTPQVDFFSGNASTTAFTLSRPVASVYQMVVVVANVIQNPGSAYTVSSNTITFSSAPPTGTNNIWVEYTSLITQVIAPSPGTVGTSQLQSNLTLGGTTTASTITSAASTNLSLQTNNGTTAVTIDTNQNFGLGVTPSAWNSQYKFLQFTDSTSAYVGGSAYAATLGANSYINGSSNWVRAGASYGVSQLNQFNGQFIFNQAASGSVGSTITWTQAMTLATNQAGNPWLGIGLTSAGFYETLGVTGNSGSYVLRLVNSSASSNNYGLTVGYASAPNGTGNQFFSASDSSVLRMELRSNGGIANYSANNANLSDRREKTNFAPAGDYLAKICAIPVQTYNYIDQNLEEDDGLTLGVVAQDVQAVAPELVTESDWSTEKDGSKMRLSIYQTDMQYALMKCIQELSAQVTTLQTQVTALQTKVGV